MATMEENLNSKICPSSSSLPSLYDQRSELTFRSRREAIPKLHRFLLVLVLDKEPQVSPIYFLLD